MISAPVIDEEVDDAKPDTKSSYSFSTRLTDPEALRKDSPEKPSAEAFLEKSVGMIALSEFANPEGACLLPKGGWMAESDAKLENAVCTRVLPESTIL